MLPPLLRGLLSYLSKALRSSLQPDGSRLVDVFGRTVGAGEAAGGDAPGSVAIKTTIVDKIPLLETLRAAARADAAFVQPVTVGIEAIFDMTFIDSDFQVTGQGAGSFPGVDFHP